ncbi:GtrA family protein [Pseudonocardia sp. H11422]|uniref:GtrA family protein n=1 Tax=Pseudonocardia sp. H11422 TaxID=2835866 RepID=UPI0027E37C9F|nr:GtrA family protein [Pseudonocardia sp. H11422]
MTATRSEPASLSLFAQLSRFVAVGAVSALVDFGVYHLLLSLGTWVHAAKGISFILGTTTAYLLNRRFTFTATEGGKGRFAAFVALYATTFAFNVGMNALALALLPDMPMRTSVAWVIAQGCATAINFVMLRTVVFRR